MSITLSALQKQRRDTAANWTAEDPTLLAGEIGLESDTGYWKVGDGSTAWTSLAYVSGLGAEISVDRLADGAARQLLQTDAAGTGVEWTDDVDVPGTLDVTGVATFDDDVTIQGDLTVNGTTTTIDTTTLVVEDKNIEIGKVATPTDVTADGGGITLKGDTDKTINWIDATDAWTFSEHVDLASAKEYRIAGTKVLDATSLGSAVVSSSLTSVGTIGTGVWQGTTVATGYGGTGQTTYTDGELLIGKTDGTLAKATITQGSGVTITNGDGTITIAATGSGGTVTAVTGTSPIASTGGTTPDISIQDATTTQKGAVQLEDSTSSTSTTTAATPNSVKSAYDLANAALPASGGTVTGDVTLNAQSDLRFADSDSSNWVAFQGPASVSSNVTWTLPDADGTSGDVLSTDGAGVLSWTTVGGGGATDKIEEGNTSAEVIDTGSDGRFVVTTEGSERARIDSSGRLLVGTSSAPGSDSTYSRLSVVGNTAGGNAAGEISLLTATSAASVNYSGAQIGVIRFGDVNGNPFARIECVGDEATSAGDFPGRLVFSTTADGASSPTQAVTIKNNQDVLLTTSTDATNTTGWYGTFIRTAGGGVSISRNGSNAMAFYHTSNANGLSGAPVGTISITTTATAYNTSSDYRLKKNVVPLTGAIDRLNDLQVHRFNFIADPDTTVDGFIAHEAQAVVPECVTGTKDEVDDEGNPVYQGIDQSKLVPLLTAALQEALQKIEDLEGRLTAAGL